MNRKALHKLFGVLSFSVSLVQPLAAISTEAPLEQSGTTPVVASTSAPDAPDYHQRVVDYQNRLNELLPEVVEGSQSPSFNDYLRAAYQDKLSDVVEGVKQVRTGRSRPHTSPKSTGYAPAENMNKYMRLDGPNADRHFDLHQIPKQEMNVAAGYVLNETDGDVFLLGLKGVGGSHVLGHEIGHKNQELESPLFKGLKKIVERIRGSVAPKVYDSESLKESLLGYTLRDAEFSVRMAELKRGAFVLEQKAVVTPQDTLDMLGMYGFDFDEGLVRKYAQKEGLNSERYFHLIGINRELEAQKADELRAQAGIPRVGAPAPVLDEKDPDVKLVRAANELIADMSCKDIKGILSALNEAGEGREFGEKVLKKALHVTPLIVRDTPPKPPLSGRQNFPARPTPDFGMEV